MVQISVIIIYSASNSVSSSSTLLDTAIIPCELVHWIIDLFGGSLYFSYAPLVVPL